MNTLQIVILAMIGGTNTQKNERNLLWPVLLGNTLIPTVNTKVFTHSCVIDANEVLDPKALMCINMKIIRPVTPETIIQKSFFAVFIFKL